MNNGAAQTRPSESDLQPPGESPLLFSLSSWWITHRLVTSRLTRRVKVQSRRRRLIKFQVSIVKISLKFELNRRAVTRTWTTDTLADLHKIIFGLLSLCLEIYRLELMSVSGHKSIVTFYFYFSPGKLGSVWMNLWKCGPNMQMARLVFISVVWHAWRGRPAGKFFGRVSRSISTHDQPESLWNLMTGPLFCFFF